MSSVLFTRVSNKSSFSSDRLCLDTWSASEDEKQTITFKVLPTFKVAYRVYLLVFFKVTNTHSWVRISVYQNVMPAKSEQGKTKLII